MGGGPGEGCTVRARACTKSVCSPFLDEVARKSAPGAVPERKTSSALKRRHSRLRRQAARLSSLCRGVDWDGLAFPGRKGGQVEVTGGSAGPGPPSTRRTGQGEGWPPDRRHGLLGIPEGGGPPRGRLNRGTVPLPAGSPGWPRLGVGPVPSGAWEEGVTDAQGCCTRDGWPEREGPGPRPGQEP
jgi:hypothetical protein